MTAHDVAELQLVDVTLRDGGYLNDHSWTLQQARDIVRVVATTGVRYIEVGYLRPDAADNLPAAASPRDYLSALEPLRGQAELAVMIRAAVSAEDIAMAADCGVGLVRFPVLADRLPAVTPLIDLAKQHGLQVGVNLIRVSQERIAALRVAARIAEEAGADVVYAADSNGSLLPDTVRTVISELGDATRLPVGFHAHDNMRLAFANSLAALDAHADYLDASFRGLGKGGGNLQLELVLGYLRSLGRSDLTPAALPELDALVGKEREVMGDTAFLSLVSGVLDLNYDAAGELFQQPWAAVAARIAPQEGPAGSVVAGQRSRLMAGEQS